MFPPNPVPRCAPRGGAGGIVAHTCSKARNQKWDLSTCSPCISPTSAVLTL